MMKRLFLILLASSATPAFAQADPLAPAETPPEAQVAEPEVAP